ADTDRPDEQPVISAPYPGQDEASRRVDAQIAVLKRKYLQPTPPSIAARVWQRNPLTAEVLVYLAEAARVNKARPRIPTLPVMVELPPAKQRKTHLMVKGNFLSPADAVEPAVPAAFHPLPKGASGNRLGVAEWLLSPDNPLTARVAVNRFWAQLFGTGLVETEE